MTEQNLSRVIFRICLLSAQPITDIADILVDLLLQRVQDAEKPLESHYVLPVKLVQR